MITKIELDKLVEKYENEDFIKDDPVQFLHKFKEKKDIELAAFCASLLAYGSRKQFIQKLNQLFDIAQYEPLNFIQNYEEGCLGAFNYRFGKPNDFNCIFKSLKEIYNSNCSLEDLFKSGYEKNTLFQTVTDYFYERADGSIGHGFYHMIPNPNNGGAMKRMCMLLRWLVRTSVVDVGIWHFMSKSELYIPLDVHVGNVSRQMGLLTRKANDFKAVLELTNNLKKFCPEDPIKYDFAMFGYGVNNK